MFTSTGELSDAFKQTLLPITSPIGSVVFWCAPKIPDGWLVCNGAEISRTTYASLFSVVGTAWGPAASADNFKLPNLAGKVPVGADNSTFIFGTTVGAETVALTEANLPVLTFDDIIATTEIPVANTFGTPPNAKVGDFSDRVIGSGNPHSNVQPSTVGHWIIRVS